VTSIQNGKEELCSARMRNLRALHGGLLLALLLVPMVGPGLSRWPLYLLVPLLMYALVVCAVGPLRRSVCWLRAGQLNGGVLATTGLIILVSSVALILYAILFQPDVNDLMEQLPLWLPVPLAVTGAVFCVVNALLEEIMFRGILLDALDAQLGSLGAILIQGVAFGVVHAHGYPPGVIGMLLASLYGLMLGLLRLQAGGLVAPCIAHVCADATIFTIVVSAQ
jgi:membrane protease YdiL (CAAX protease family)